MTPDRALGPTDRTAGEGDAARHPDALNDPDDRAYRIFIVDDDRRMVAALSELLGAARGIRVAGCADNEDSAVEWLLNRASGWDLVVVDLALRSGSGLRVLSACRVRRAAQKVVVLSGHLDAAMRRRCQLLGADAAFSKDGDIESLVGHCVAAAKGRP